MSSSPVNQHGIKVTFWGVRGSIPTPLTPGEIEAKVIEIAEEVIRAGISDPGLAGAFIQDNFPNYQRGTVGGNTSCVSVEWPGATIILDAGTGIRMLGKELMKREFSRGKGVAHLLFSHTHWDHIMGFPYFAPLFKSNTIHLHGGHPDLEDRLRQQQDERFYPVPLDIFDAKLHFHHVEEGHEYPLPGDGCFEARKLLHPGDSFGYKITWQDRSVVFITDSEYKLNNNGLFENVRDFTRGADLLIFDSQYTLEESLIREDWGHSTAVIGVKLAVEAGVKQLALFHHEPNYGDSFIHGLVKSANDYRNNTHPGARLQIHLAVEGSCILL